MIEVFMLATEAPHNSEVGIEQILAVASVGHAIVNDLLDNDIECSVAVE
jgi:hypothetical protein